MPSSLRDEYHVRTGYLEREAQTLHLLCVNFQFHNQRHDYEDHIAELVKRLERIQAVGKEGNVEK